MSLEEKQATPKAPDNGEHEFLRRQRFRVLYKTLARSIIRELYAAGCRGNDLLGFVNEVMRAITEDENWERGLDGQEDKLPEALDVPVALPISRDLHNRPTLLTERLILRPPALCDKACLEHWQRDELVRASLIPSLLQHISQHLSTLHTHEDRVDLIICDRKSQVPIGLVTLHEIDRVAGQAELGKVIGEPAFRRRGLAQEAVRQILAYGFEALDLNRVYLRTLGANISNIRLNQRMGFRFEGVMHQVRPSGGEPVDIVLMAILRRDAIRRDDGASRQPRNL